MHHLTCHTFRARSAFLCALVVIAGALTLCATVDHADASSTYRGPLSFADASAGTNNTTVINTATVSSQGISLGSTLEVAGRATLDGQSVMNAPVALHMGDTVVATTNTSTTGEYAFAVPVGVYYLPAAISGAADVYTVVSVPYGTSPNVSSGVTTVAVDSLPFYVVVVVVVIVVLLVALYLHVRRKRGKAPRSTPTRPTSAAQPVPPEDGARTTAEQQVELGHHHGTESGDAASSALPTQPVTEPEHKQGTERESPPSGSAHESLHEYTLESPSESEADRLHKYGIAVSMDALTQPRLLTKHEGSIESTSPLRWRGNSPEGHAGTKIPTSDRSTKPSGDTPDHVNVVGADTDDNDVLAYARDRFMQGQDRQAIAALYDAAITALIDASGISLPAHVTEWERYDAIECAVPEIRAPLRRLTLAYELSNYRSTPLAKKHRDGVIEAFCSIMRHLDEHTQAPSQP